eukprot:12427946-Prorocentrum_lima.AAC.1
MEDNKRRPTSTDDKDIEEHMARAKKEEAHKAEQLRHEHLRCDSTKTTQGTVINAGEMTQK